MSRRGPGPDDTDPVSALFALPLEEFVAARDAVAARFAADGDADAAKSVKALKKPTVAAWVANRVARTWAAEVADLAALGDRLRAATRDRDRSRLRSLDQERRDRVGALVDEIARTGEIDGRQVTADSLRKLAETLGAAVADPGAAAAVRAGRLSRTLQHVGFGLVDEDGEPADFEDAEDAEDGTAEDAAVEDAEPGEDEAGREASEEARARAAAQAEERAAEVAAAQRAEDDARTAVGELEAEHEHLTAKVERLSAKLAKATDARDRTADELAQARHALDRAVAARENADGGGHGEGNGGGTGRDVRRGRTRNRN
ncbi:hypothetical protein [Oerskovia flava]|uniref:hypothetical protein n=1 Tax=Oerskovia flava TaxID=2986422 RepID=UPI0022407DFF|nr:hypothetical protein [Oerskovia sp. JB1-3-2]